MSMVGRVRKQHVAGSPVIRKDKGATIESITVYAVSLNCGAVSYLLMLSCVRTGLGPGLEPAAASSEATV